MSNSIQQSLEHATKIENMLIESGGEITPEIEQELSFGAKSLEETVDLRFMSLERINKSIEYYKEKAEQFLKIASSLDKSSDFISNSIKQFMVDNQKKELIGTDYRFMISPSKPKLNIIDESLINGVYKKEKIETVLDKDSIKEDLVKGIPVDGCELVEGFTLRKYVNKGGKK